MRRGRGVTSLGIGIIGAGRWGKNHALALKRLKGVRLLAVCDLIKARAEHVAELTGAKSYCDADNLMQREDVAAVTICTTWSELGDLAIRALENGKHVLVEKPMAANSAEAKRIVETARRKNLIITTGFLMRYLNGVRYLKNRLEGEIGNEPVWLISRRVSGGPQSIVDQKMGVMRDLAIHDIDMARYLFRREPIRVDAKAFKMRHEGIMDNAMMELTFPNRRKARIEVTWTPGPIARTLTLIESNYEAQLDYVSQKLTIMNPTRHEQENCPCVEALDAELQDFVISVINRKQPCVAGLDGVNALRVVEAAMESLELGEPVDISNCNDKNSNF